MNRVSRPRKRLARFLNPWRERTDISPGESIRVERVISVARVFLSIVATVALGLDHVDPPAYAPIARALLILFTAHSISAVLVLRTQPREASAFVRATFGVDLLSAALTLPMASHALPFFFFFLFVLGSAAFRWGFRETAITTAASVLILVLYDRAVDWFRPVFDGDSDPNRLFVRVVYLMMMGLLLGYLADQGRMLRAESASVVQLLGKIRADVNVTRALTTVGNEVVNIFDGSHLLLVVEELDSQRLFRWDTIGGWTLASTSARGESVVVERPIYFFGASDHSMAVVRHKWPWASRPSYDTITLDPSGRFVERARVVIPETFAEAHPFRRLIVAPVTFGDAWSGRIFVFEPQLNAHLIELTEFLQTLIRQVSPAVFSVYLQNRLQARAGALERARVARELHDGVIQSLIGVEMQVEVLRGQATVRDNPVAGDLMRIQNLLRNEVLNLRDLMQQMRPAEFDPDELLDHLADMVQRFGRDAGIKARFLTDLKDVALERHVCFELVRIVQEGLANIRKHSAATNVVVRFGVGERAWRLEIDDDGRGFPFEGRLTHTELDAKSLGPAIIKERVRAISGQLTIDSRPGRGCHLVVLVPQEARG